MIRLSCLVMATLATIYVAHAEPPPGADPNSPVAQWYRSLMVPGTTNQSCCSVSDCRPVEARQTPNGWEVEIDNAWRPVPAPVVLRRTNEDGRPIACIFLGEIRCFLPPAAT
jgi:hypothetical protein